MLSSVTSSLIPAITSILTTSATVVPLCIATPVNAPLVRGYEAPLCTYCVGHRTLDFAGDDAESVILDVVAPLDGRVRFAGFVVHIYYVSIAPSMDPARTVTVGWSPVEMSPVEMSSVDMTMVDRAAPTDPVRVGHPVRAGSRLGITRAGSVVTLSLRNESGDYEDPGPYLGSLKVRARLVPLDGSGRRPPPSAVCRPVR
ncbi:MAG: hypothetical protein RL391_1862 [Actinomycetota bacterium]